MAEFRRLRTQADDHGNRPDACGHCTLLPGVNGPVRAVQTGCPVHGDWVRTQAERDAARPHIEDAARNLATRRLRKPVEPWEAAACHIATDERDADALTEALARIADEVRPARYTRRNP